MNITHQDSFIIRLINGEHQHISYVTVRKVEEKDSFIIIEWEDSEKYNKAFFNTNQICSIKFQYPT